MTYQKEEKECIWVKYLIYAVLLQFQISHHLRVFPPNLYSQKFRVHKKKVFFSQVCTVLVQVLDPPAGTTTMPRVRVGADRLLDCTDNPVIQLVGSQEKCCFHLLSVHPS